MRSNERGKNKVGYNVKYPSGLRKETLWPPLSITLAFDNFPGRANPLTPIPAKSNNQ